MKVAAGIPAYITNTSFSPTPNLRYMKMRKVLIPVLSLFALLYSGSVFSACGSTQTQCYHFKNGKLVNSSECTYSNCANVHGASTIWKWPNGDEMSSGKGDAEYRSGKFFNGKPASSYIKKSENNKNKMECFKGRNKTEVFCGNIEESCCF